MAIAQIQNRDSMLSIRQRLNQTITSLAEAMDAIADIPSNIADDFVAIYGRIVAAENDIATLAPLIGQMAALTARVVALEASSGGVPPDLSAIEAEIEDLRNALENVLNSLSGLVSSADLEAIRASLQGQIDLLTGGAPIDLTSVKIRLEALEADMATVAGQISTAITSLRTEILGILTPMETSLQQYADIAVSTHDASTTSHSYIRNLIADIRDLIPISATITNQLADKDYVIEHVYNMTARHLSYDNQGYAFPTFAHVVDALDGVANFYHAGVVTNPSVNDVVTILSDERYGRATESKFDGATFIMFKRLSAGTLTQEQLNVINNNVPLQPADARDSTIASTEFVQRGIDTVPRDFLPLSGGQIAGNVDVSGRITSSTASIQTMDVQNIYALSYLEAQDVDILGNLRAESAMLHGAVTLDTVPPNAHASRAASVGFVRDRIAEIDTSGGGGASQQVVMRPNWNNQSTIIDIASGTGAYDQTATISGNGFISGRLPTGSAAGNMGVLTINGIDVTENVLLMSPGVTGTSAAPTGMLPVFVGDVVRVRGNRVQATAVQMRFIPAISTAIGINQIVTQTLTAAATTTPINPHVYNLNIDMTQPLVAQEFNLAIQNFLPLFFRVNIDLQGEMSTGITKEVIINLPNLSHTQLNLLPWRGLPALSAAIGIHENGIWSGHNAPFENWQIHETQIPMGNGSIGGVHLGTAFVRGVNQLRSRTSAPLNSGPRITHQGNARSEFSRAISEIALILRKIRLSFEFLDDNNKFLKMESYWRQTGNVDT